MATLLVGIGGSGSDSGKTTVACRLLESLGGWGAIKCEPSSLYTAVLDDPETLGTPGKDTSRMLEAGAAEALWVRAPRDDMEEALEMARDRLSHCAGVVVEGNSAIEVLNPDVIIFIAAGASPEAKASAARVLKKAHAVIFDGKPPEGAPQGAGLFGLDEVEGYREFILGLIDERRSKKSSS